MLCGFWGNLFFIYLWDGAFLYIATSMLCFFSGLLHCDTKKPDMSSNDTPSSSKLSNCKGMNVVFKLNTDVRCRIVFFLDIDLIFVFAFSIMWWLYAIVASSLWCQLYWYYRADKKCNCHIIPNISTQMAYFWDLNQIKLISIDLQGLNQNYS